MSKPNVLLFLKKLRFSFSNAFH